MGQAKKVFRVITVSVGKPPKVEFVGNPFDHCRELISGPVGIVHLSDGNDLLCDEEAEATGIPFNRAVPDVVRAPAFKPDFVVAVGGAVPLPAGEVGVHRVRGTFVIAKFIPDPENEEGGSYADLSDGDLERYNRYLGSAVSYLCERCGEALAYPGGRYCGAGCSAAAEMHI
jgi:hypothetical protein